MRKHFVDRLPAFVEPDRPDFDDEPYSPVPPTPFGRPTFQGFGSGTFSPTLDSPTTPTIFFGNHDRAFFPSHNRADSAASVESTGSGFARATHKSTPFAHSSRSSIITTTSTSAFPKKPSFASIRNAFKSGKNPDAPPVPQLENHPYPILKNPFNRSTSSLNQSMVTASRPATSSAFPRPPTPTAKSAKKFHGRAKSHHSQTGSFYHASDGSDPGNPLFPISPPPVPRVPRGLNQLYLNDTPSNSDFEEDKIVIDLKTPSDFALHAVFIRFAEFAEKKIDAFLRLPLVSLLDIPFAAIYERSARTRKLLLQNLWVSALTPNSTIFFDRLGRLPRNMQSL